MIPQKTRGMWYLVVVGIVALSLVAGLVALQPDGRPLNWLIRGVALSGYLSIFLAIVSSAYIKQVVRAFGRPFINVHHILAMTGLVLITLHPLGVAMDAASLSVFLPRFDSWAIFLDLGGRVAWYLLAAAVLVAVLRKSIGESWRVAHLLTYVAFWLGTIHAIRIGASFQVAVMKIAPMVSSLVVVAIFIQKRFPKRK